MNKGVVSLHGEIEPNAERPKPRILWANAYCLMDTSSGASMSVREILKQLAVRGFDVCILGATNFDSESGSKVLDGARGQLTNQKAVKLKDGELIHTLVVTKERHVSRMTVDELAVWFRYYQQLLDEFQPDLVFLYGGKPHDYLVSDEARRRGISTVFYLANGNYHGHRWYRDIDMIVTDSSATAQMYKERLGVELTPFGKFIDPTRFVASQHTRENILFVNPSLSKGGLIAVQFARLLEQLRPEINIEVVESRGKWSAAVQQLASSLGLQQGDLANVLVTENSADMRPVYGRTRLVFHPSLWWESGSRVLAEATLNGIPSIVTNRGGALEMVGDSGVVLNLPQPCFDKPYNKVPSLKQLEPLAEMIIRMYDDEPFYQQYVARAFVVGRERHDMQKNVDRLATAFKELIAGNIKP